MVRRRHRAEVGQVRPRAPAAARGARRRCGCSARATRRCTASGSGSSSSLSGHREVDGMIAQHAAMARALAEQLGLPDAVLDALGAAYEQWDGRGWPGRARGATRCRWRRGSRSSRSSSRSRTASAASSGRGRSRAARAGKQFDPALARARLRRRPTLILAGLDSVGTWDAVIDAEPALAVVLSGDAVRRGAARDRELRRPEVAVHARPRARRRRASPPRPVRSSGSGRATCSTLRRAGLVHDFGRLGRLERDLGQARAARRRRVGARADPSRISPSACCTSRRRSRRSARSRSQHRERLDGSGYPRGLSGAAISRPARILGAADAYQAMREPRPHRPRARRDDAAAELRGRGQGRPARRRRRRGGARRRRPSRAGAGARARPGSRRARSRSCACSRAGSRTSRSPRGSSISPKTVGNHIEHIYAKIDASTRAAASLFAMQHGLLPDEDLPRTS